MSWRRKRSTCSSPLACSPMPSGNSHGRLATQQAAMFRPSGGHPRSIPHAVHSVLFRSRSVARQSAASTTGSGAGGTLIRVTPLDRWERRTGLATVVLVRAPGRAQVDLLVGCGHGVVLASWSSNLPSYSPNLSRILRARSASSSERSYASLLTSPIRRSRSAQPWPPGSCGGNVGSTGDLPDKSLEEPSTASIGWAAPLRGGQGTQPAYIWHTRAHEKGP
jgi:hypothetical protein